jgi:hypothetical protein
LFSALKDPNHFEDSSTQRTRPGSTPQTGPPSVFSNDIFLGDNSGESLAFARDVKIGGWTSVGDKLGGAYIGENSHSTSDNLFGVLMLLAYIVYDCAITTKEVCLISNTARPCV